MGRFFGGYDKTREYVELWAEGFHQKVPGVVFTDQARPCCGVPLGGIGTGCIDYDLRGVFGWSTLFHPFSQILSWPDGRVPRRHPELQPVFAFSVGDECFIAATEEIRAGGHIEWCTAPAGATEDRKPPQHHLDLPEIPGVTCATGVEYYGHFPVADAEYAFDAKVSLGVRAWSSFIPGDTARTNIPAAFFEARLRNESAEEISGNLAMNFAGPNHQEARATFFSKRRVSESATGVYVCSEGGVNYFLGAFGEADAMTGTGLMEDHAQEHGYGTSAYGKPNGYANLASGLPQDRRFVEKNGARLYKDPSASVGVQYRLKPGEEQSVQFVLTWYAPIFESAVRMPAHERAAEMERDWLPEAEYGDEAHYAPMYAMRFDSALDVLRRVAPERGLLLRKVLAWQEALLTRKELPAWLRDSLLNILCLLAEDGYWFQPKYPIGDWAFPGGAFTYFESPRDCPHSSCIPNDWISTMHLTYLFPDLYLQLLRSYKAVQRADGEIPFAVGRCGEVPNFAYPEYTWQMSLNGSCYIMMVDRLWTITKDDAVPREFYESIKRCNDFMRGLAKKGWLCIPDRGGAEWFEFSKFYGYTSHVGGVHLSQLLIVERMARHMGDAEYADRCRAEYEEARALYEEKLWHGTHYLTWLDEDTGRRNDTVMAYQFDGLFTNAQAGIGETMYDPERLRIGLDTIYRANVRLGNGRGALNYANADGTYIDDSDAYGKYCIFTQNTIVLAMTDLYAGNRERALELARTTWRNLIIEQGLGWDCTHIVSALDGTKRFGADYNQQSVIWSLIPALEGGDVSVPCRPGHVIYDLVKAAKNCE